MTNQNTPLTERQKIEREIETCRESIRLNHVDLARADDLQLDAEARAGIRKNSELLAGELKELLDRRDRLDGKNS